MATAILSRTSVRRIPWALIGRIGLALSVVTFAFQLPFFLSPGLGTVLSELSQMLQLFAVLMLATVVTRTVRISTLVSFWFAGVYPVMALALIVGRPLALSLGVDNPLVYAFWVPLTEEILKALPVALFFILAARRGTWQPSASDGLLLGCAAGAGFAFHEDVMVGRTGGGGVGGALPWSLVDPGILHRGAVLVFSHSGWTALVSLSIGVAFVYRDVLWTRLVPVATFLVVVFDHMISNYDNGGRSAPALASALHLLDLNGLLPILGLIAGVSTVVILERRTLRRASEMDRWFPAIPLAEFVRRVGPPTNWPAIIRWQAFWEYVLARRSLYFAAARWARRGAPTATQAQTARMTTMVDLVFQRGVEAGLRRAS